MTIQRMTLLGIVSGALIFDLWVIAGRCTVSPAIPTTAMLCASGLQAIAVGIPIALDVKFGAETVRFRVRGILIALFCLLISLPVFETSALYGDSIGREKGYLSAGLQCHGHLRWFRDGPNLRMSRPLGIHHSAALTGRLKADAADRQQRVESV
jgi:hypothetical protein